MIENKDIPFYKDEFYELPEERKQKLIARYGEAIFNKYNDRRIQRRQYLKSPAADDPSQQHLKLECHTLSKWMAPDDFAADLKEIKEILEKQGEHFWMQYAVLLCNHRDGEFFFSDHDIDISLPLNIKPEDLPKWKEILYERFKPFADAGFEVECYDSKRYLGQRIQIRKRVVTDFFLYDEWDGHYVFSDFYDWADYQAWPKDLFDNLEEVDFNGVMFPAPKNVEESLRLDYGEGWETYDAKKIPLNVARIPWESFKGWYEEKVKWRLDSPVEMTPINNALGVYKKTLEELQQ